jgi:hypothetical protein
MEKWYLSSLSSSERNTQRRRIIPPNLVWGPLQRAWVREPERPRGKSAPAFVLLPAPRLTAQTATAIATPQLTRPTRGKVAYSTRLALLCTLAAALDEGQRGAQGPSIPQAGQVVLL